MYFLADRVQSRVGPRLLWVPAGHDAFSDRHWLWLGDRALVWAPEGIADRRVLKLADGRAESLALATRTALTQIAADREYRGVDAFDATIARLLLTPPEGKWGALRPSKTRRRYEILLGPRADRLFWSQAAFVGPNTKTYIDTFNRSNSSTLGTSSDGQFSWSELGGTTLAISGNRLAATNIPNGSSPAATTSADCDTDDVYAQFTLVTYTRAAGSNLYSEIACACNASRTSGYQGGVGNDYGTNNPVRYLFRISDDAGIDDDAVSTTSGELRVERDGSTIRMLVGGVEILSGTDTSQSSGAGYRRAGLMVYSDGNSTNDLAWDNFGYGDIETGGATVEVGIAGDTSTALAVSSAKSKSGGLASEADSVLAITARKSRVISLPTETGSALPVERSKKKSVGLSEETDSVLSVKKLKAMSVGLASETGSALAVAHLKAKAIGLSEEDDSALAVSRSKLRAVALTTETDSALGLVLGRSVVVGPAESTESALSVERRKLRVVGLGTETDSALALQRLKRRSVGGASDSSGALPVSRSKGKTIGLAEESDAALALQGTVAQLLAIRRSVFRAMRSLSR